MNEVVQIPAEPEWPVPVFATVRRGGYDPAEVDPYVAAVEAELADLRWQVEDIAARRAQLDAEREAFVAERDNWRPSYAGLSARARNLARLLEREARDTRAHLRHETSTADAAIAERRRLAEVAIAEQKRNAELEAAGILAQARAQADRLLTDAQAEAWAVRDGAARDLALIGRRRDEALQQLEVLAERILAVRRVVRDAEPAAGPGADGGLSSYPPAGAALRRPAG
jgi:cell division septum initiation protein DivIVA